MGAQGTEEAQQRGIAGVKCLEEAAMISSVKDKWELSNEWREEELCSRQI